MNYAFEEFPKIPRLKREIVVTEKIDGTNAQIAFVQLNTPEQYVTALNDPFCIVRLPALHDGDCALALYAGSRNRWLTPEKDNFGFCKWVLEHADELRTLGPGRHYGEWFGLGIQRGYGLQEKRFALFNVTRWNVDNTNRPACCTVVPTLARGDDINTDVIMQHLHTYGSMMAPGFMNPEGIVVYHTASRQMYKRTFEQDGGKWSAT